MHEFLITQFWLTEENIEFLYKYSNLFKVVVHHEKKFNDNRWEYDNILRYTIEDNVWNIFSTSNTFTNNLL